MTSPLVVRFTDELRLAGALLAAGEWPDHEQSVKAYKPHRAAEAARRYFAPYRSHPAVQAAAGAGAHRLYAWAATGAWPAGLAEHLPGFIAEAQPEVLWAATQPAWTLAEDDLCAVLTHANLPAFLAALFGPLAQTLVVYPNLLYPGRQPLAFEAGAEMLIAQPPPPAWGTSPPWRYSERPDEVLAVLATTAAECLFERRLPAAHAALRPHVATFALAAAVLFLRQSDDPAAGDQYLVMEKKARRLPQLPYVVAALEAALEAKPSGLGDYVADVGAVLIDK
jgi:hypothetical protein